MSYGRATKPCAEYRAWRGQEPLCGNCAFTKDEHEAYEDALATARADAIRQCVRETRRMADHSASTGDHLPGTDRARELHAEARSFRNLAARLESLLNDKSEKAPT